MKPLGVIESPLEGKGTSKTLFMCIVSLFRYSRTRRLRRRSARAARALPPPASGGPCRERRSGSPAGPPSSSLETSERVTWAMGDAVGTAWS
eukprot:2440603-Prymnesium_polylepis.1